jgi:SAM-dependent methyltransferase
VELLEVSDLVRAHDPTTGARLPVRRDELLDRLLAAGDRRGARVVRRLPVDGSGVLDPDGVDAVLLRCHRELQRLSEELQQGRRVADVLAPLLAAVREVTGVQRPRVVDVGCGLGHVVRWLAWHRPVGPVELVGCDLDRALLREADRLAEAERLDCVFVEGDALALDQPADVVISTGFLHHLRGDDLPAFLRRQQAVPAVAHWDIAPGPLTGLGARLFHRARMREPLARHDGVVSALRAYDDATVVGAVRCGAPGLVPLLVDASPGRNPLVAVMRPVLGLRPDLVEPFLDGCPPRLRRRVTPV